MQNITIGQIATILAFLVGLITSVKYLAKEYKTSLKGTLKEELEPIENKLDEMRETEKQMKINSYKNFLVLTMNDLENGIPLTNTTIQRMYETYDEYTKLGGNSYIHKKFEDLRKQGKL